MKKIVVVFVICLLAMPAGIFAVTENDARNVANETLLNLMELNLLLQGIKKKEDITAQVKTGITQVVKKMKALKNKVNAMKRSATPQQIKLLDDQFNKGQYAIALKKAVVTFFEHVKRIRTISGGEEIANMVVI